MVKIAWAVQEERFTRVKHDASFPHQSINFILESEGIGLSDIEYVAFYDKPFLKFEVVGNSDSLLLQGVFDVLSVYDCLDKRETLYEVVDHQGA